MNQMTRAYSRLKEKLPNHENINSKKQIVDQVRYSRNKHLPQINVSGINLYSGNDDHVGKFSVS